MSSVTLPITQYFFLPVNEEINNYEIFGMAVIITGLIFESSGDFELLMYKKDKSENKPKILDEGLRRYLRFP